jgi:hypothetical protein
LAWRFSADLIFRERRAFEAWHAQGPLAHAHSDAHCEEGEAGGSWGV